MTWLKECGKVDVTKRVLLKVTIGKYSDEVWCEVVPLKSFHILFGMPWRYEMNVIYDTKRNMYKFLQDRVKITLAELTLEQSFADRWKVRGEAEREKQKREMTTRKKNTKVKLHE